MQLQVLHPAFLVQHEGAHHRQRAPHTLPEILFRARVALPHFQTRGGEPGDDEQGVHGSQALPVGGTALPASATDAAWSNGRRVSAHGSRTFLLYWHSVSASETGIAFCHGD